MNLLPDELKLQTFTCPNCKQYISISTEFCKICALAVTDEMRIEGIEREMKNEIVVKDYKNVRILGIVILALGIMAIFTNLVFALSSKQYFFEGQLFFYMIIACLIIGSGLIFFSLFDYIKQIIKK